MGNYRGCYGPCYLTDRNGVEGFINVRLGTDDDVGVDEVWGENVYRMHPDYVKDGVVLDIGANVGAFSIWAAAAGASRVMAFEPEKANFEALKVNARMFPQILPIDSAISDYLGMGSVSGMEIGTGSATLVGGDDFQVEKFSSILELNRESGQDIAVLKMDIEGSEYRCFRDIESTDLSGVVRIVMEFHGPGLGHELGSGEFGQMVEKIAEWGHVDILGRPSVGGMIYGIRY